MHEFALGLACFTPSNYVWTKAERNSRQNIYLLVQYVIYLPVISKPNDRVFQSLIRVANIHEKFLSLRTNSIWVIALCKAPEREFQSILVNSGWHCKDFIETRLHVPGTLHKGVHQITRYDECECNCILPAMLWAPWLTRWCHER